MIQVDDVSFSYSYPEQGTPTLRHVNLSIAAGEFVAVVGPNGSGKSTLAKLISGLLNPSQGNIYIGDVDLAEEHSSWSIGPKVGLVFQNPENQMVASTVMDDVAFGLENIGFPPELMAERVKHSLEKVGMWGHHLSEPHHLSGGQKQRVAIAGILAMKPGVIIFDESTSMLDPEGRQQMITLMKELHQEGLTMINITHDMEEAMEASRVIVMNKGSILKDGTPAEVFEEIKLLINNQLQPPFVIQVREYLIQNGIPLPREILSQEELIKHLWTFI